MVSGIDPLVYLETTVARLVLATLLGMFLGLEREWSQKSAGIRTFALISLAAAVFSVADAAGLLVVGGVLIVASAVLLAVRSFVEADVDGLSLTTSVSMLVAYGVGVLVAASLFIEAVTVAVLSSSLLVLKRELHQFARRLSHGEVRGAAEFAIIAFVVYPLLPAGTFGPLDAIDPQLVWTLVIAVSGIGFANYAIMQRYGGRGMLITGFFGGLVNSTAVIGEIATRAKTNDGIMTLAVATVLVADAAMAVRNLVLVVAFVPESAVAVGLPLGLIAVGGVGLTVYERNWGGDIELDLDSPFSSRNALAFGVLFLAVLVGTAAAQGTFGTAGFLVTSFLSGLLSSGTTTATAVSLTSTGRITAATAAQGALAGTLASIMVKIWLAAGINRTLLVPITTRSAALSALGLVGVLVVQLL